MTEWCLRNVRLGQRLDIPQFACQTGQITVLLGANGAGKSSLLHVLSGHTRADSGEVLWNGQTLPSANMLAKRRAMLPQHPVLPADFSVDTLLRATAPCRLPETLLGQVLAELDLSHLRQRPSHTLSGGESQRLLLAKAVLQLCAWHTPATGQFLLLDEPSAALDVHHTLLLQNCLQRWRRRYGWGVVFSTHDIRLAEQADVVVLMQQGRILAQGHPAQVLTTETLQQAYGCTFAAFRHPQYGRVWQAVDASAPPPESAC